MNKVAVITKHRLADPDTLYHFVMLCAMATAFCLGGSDAAFAQFTAPCAFIWANMSNGGVVPAIASIGVIMLGVGAILGKVSWGMAVLVAVGIAVIFGYGAIVTTLGGAGCNNISTYTYTAP